MKNRTALRAYFLSNSIPTEANFHELINSSLNQEEDGIRRAVNGPIELEAQGTAGEMLHLYGSFKDSAALWKISHKPALAGAAGTAGLNIADAQASRLFIKAGDGSVGIGTDAPDRPLTVQAAGGNGEWLSLKATDGKTKFHLNNAGGGLNLAETGVADFRLFVKAGGNVGIGTSTPAAKLHLYGGGSELMFGSGGVSKASSIQVLDDGGFGGGLLFNVHATTGSDNWPTGMSTALAIRPNGNVGIGTSTPKATLQVVRGTAEYGTAVFEGTARYSHFNYSTAEDTYIRGGKATSNVYLNDNGGNVGIGTTTPTEKIEVSGNVYTNGENTGFIADAGGSKRVGFLKYAGREGGIWRTDNQDFEIGRVNVNALPGAPSTWTTDLCVSGTGNVGIGTQDPKYPLHITKVGGPGLPNYRFYNINGPGGTSSGQTDVSIYATARVVGAEFNATSDRRLKTVIGLSDHAADLALLNRLRITDYTMRDRVQFGERIFKKVIAQELEEVFPQVVQKSVGFLPDVYASASQVQCHGEALLITLPAGLPEAATAGQRLKLIGPTGEVVVTLAEAAEAGSQQLLVTGADSLADTPEEVFVFGLEHTDVRTVDYEAVAMLNVSATQALARQVAELHQQNAALNAQCRAQGTQLDELRAAVPLLQQQVAGLLSQPMGVAQPA